MPGASTGSTPGAGLKRGPWAFFIDMNQQAEIGNRLRQIREHLGETQTVFGERFDCSRDDIANYERGLCDIPNRVLGELNRIGFGLTWLLNGKGDLLHTLGVGQTMGTGQVQTKDI